jgi:hypothetical protein
MRQRELLRVKLRRSSKYDCREIECGGQGVNPGEEDPPPGHDVGYDRLFVNDVPNAVLIRETHCMNKEFTFIIQL